MSSDITPEELGLDKKDLLDKQKEPPKVSTMSTGEIKLKDKPGRGGIQLDCMQTFGFLPEFIIVQKVQGRNNAIVVSAVIPEKILKTEGDKKK